MQKFRFNLFSFRTVQALLLAVLVISVFSQCSKKDDPEPKSSAKEITNFNISVAGGPTVSALLKDDGKTLEFLAPYVYDGEIFDQNKLKTATGSFTLSPKAESNPKSGDTQDFTKDVTYTVTAEDGSTKEYTVTKKDGTSEDADIETFWLKIGEENFEGDVHKNDKTVTIPVPYDMLDKLDGAVPTFTLSLGATANPSTGIAQDFSEPVEYEITAHAGNKETWTVTVEIQEAEANFETFSLKLGEEEFEGEIDEENKTVTFSIESTLSVENPDGWPPKIQIVRSDFLGEAIPTFTCSPGAVVTPGTGVPQDFTKEVIYKIKDAGGEEVTWTVNVEIIPMPANITVFYLYFLEGEMPPNFPVDEENAIRIQSQETTKPMHSLAKIDVENGIITYDLPLVMPEWFTADKMKNIYALVDVDWNTYVSMTPGPNDLQDFSKDVVYTLIAADGTEKTWTVKAPACYMKEKWMVDYPGLGIDDGGPQNPNSIAIIDNYLSIGRTGGLLNKADGSVSAVNLNVTDIWKGNGQAAEPTASFRSQDYPFFVTNDDAGNMIGCSLGAWNTGVNPGENANNNGHFYVYKWTNAEAAPQIVMDFQGNKDDVQFGSFGRKLQVLGDINGKALIISPNAAGDNVAARGEHYMWKVNGGVVDTENPVVAETNIQWANNAYHVLTPLGTEPVAPYYVGTRGSSDTNPTYPNLQYGNPGSFTPIPGPFAPYLLANSSANGWGNYGFLYQKLFSIGGKNMIATFSNSYAYYCFGVFDRSTEGTLVPLGLSTVEYNGTDNANGNITGGFTMEKVGNDILVYVFSTNKAVACYQLFSL